jgi:hypothetical protein
MKRTMLALAASVVALAFALPTFAQDTNTPPKTTKLVRHEFTGEVKTVDATTRVVSITGKGGEIKTFTLGEKAKIVTADKKTITLADLTVGQKVKVAYVTDPQGNMTAVRIGPPDMPKPATPAPAPATGQ